ncbi:MAG TPA: DUF1573 domain-containing protein, partial [archaeon]|nr:DUF1573 domain-containing protein [archaeon]
NNQGEEPLVIYSISSSNEVFSASPSSVTIPAAQGQIITITYSPTTKGNASATITISSNDSDESSLTLSVNGKGVAPEITLSSTAISIGAVSVGSKNSGGFSIKNDGTAELFVSSIISNNVMFTVSHSSVTILPGQNQNITVTFSPTNAGEKTATVTLVCNDSDEKTLTVTVAAIGTAPEISLSNNSVNIGYVAIGSVGVGSFTIVNEGNEQLVVSSVSSDNAVFNPSPTAAAIAPNDSQAVMLSFAPSAFGEQSGTITILSNDSDEDSLSVSVRGIGGTIEFSCGSDTVYRDSSVSVPISINNSIAAISGGQFVITPSHTNYVTFKEAGTTSRTSGWTVSHNASGNGELIVFYSGSGGSISPGRGEILTLTYEISADAPTGTEITLTLSEAKISDENQQSINVTLVHGSLTLGGCPLAGDVTIDGVVDIFDILTMVRFILGQRTFTSLQSECADINADGEIDIFDVLSCLNKVIGKDVQLAAYRNSDPSQIDIQQLKADLSALGADQSLIEDILKLLPQHSHVLPKAFSLSQNTPNPFNPSTTINYSVPEGASVIVILKVYDIRGRLIRTLADGSREPGTHTAFWDGTDESGQQASSGIYIYRLRAGDFVQTRKMVLLK